MPDLDTAEARRLLALSREQTMIHGSPATAHLMVWLRNNADAARAEAARYREALEKIAERHRPWEEGVEVEVTVPVDQCERDICDECDEYGEHDDLRTIVPCVECGITTAEDDGSLVAYLPWPCPTYTAARAALAHQDGSDEK